MSGPDNYVRVDIDRAEGVIRVYDDADDFQRLYTSCDAATIRRAEAFAASEAKRLGCEWGSNEGSGS